MSGGHGNTVELIDAVDAFARTLYMRAKQSSSSFADAALAVRQLHLALRHLRVEAADSDSLLNSADASVYARQLRPLVEDCDFALQQLETILDKYGDGNGPSGSDDHGPGPDRIAAVRNRLANEKLNVDMFLDTVQLHNPATKPTTVVDSAPATSSTGLEDIKDKLDAVAKKVFNRRDSGFSDGDNVLWEEFKTELEKEGFSPDVLRKHKDVLRAYIREMEAMSSLNGGSPPTVRGLLEYEANASPAKEMFSSIDNEKCLFSMKAERRMPDHAPAPPPPMQPPYERQSNSSQDTGTDASDALALISTRDLVAMDSLNSGMAGMHLQSPHPDYGHSFAAGSPKYLASHMDRNLPVPSDVSLSSSPVSHNFGTSPRTMPPLPPYTGHAAAPPPYNAPPRSAPRLAPDRYGKEIPMDAQWTRIKRSLISIEVLDRAGVRYEARPDYVAVLGHLSREQIADYARQSADCRAARSRREAHARSSEKFGRQREDSKSSREDDDDDSVLWDESDSTDYDDDKTSDKGTKSYPYIVNPPEKKKDSPSSTVLPKPILKKKTDTHVRFDPQPHDLENKSPRSFKEKDERERRRDQTSHRHREHRDKEGSSRHRDSERRSAERDRRSSERHRGGWDDDHHRRDRDHRDRRGDRGDRDDRNIRKKAWGETIVAGGIGGAAVSLLSVLAEAASSI